MTNAYSKNIKLHYSPSGELTQTEETINRPGRVAEAYDPFELLRYREIDGRKMRVNMLESSLTTPDAAEILRQDIRFLAFSAFAQMPTSFSGFTWEQSSTNPEESYLRDAGAGVIPQAPSGTPAPKAQLSFEGGANVKNFLHRLIYDFPMDLFRFDKIGMIRQTTSKMGRAASMTLENAVYSYLTTTANYGRADTTGDNDYGANQQTLTWNADNLRTALAIISSAKDRKSGDYLMYSGDTVICGPLMEVPVLMSLTTMALSRVHGATTAEVIGTGAVNVLGNGRINNVVISPWFSNSYAWALCDSNVDGFTLQTVEPFDVFSQPENPSSEDWFKTDSLGYLVKGYFGRGFVDDRAWFYSDSVTDATVS